MFPDPHLLWTAADITQLRSRKNSNNGNNPWKTWWDNVLLPYIRTNITFSDAAMFWSQNPYRKAVAQGLVATVDEDSANRADARANLIVALEYFADTGNAILIAQGSPNETSSDTNRDVRLGASVALDCIGPLLSGTE